MAELTKAHPFFGWRMLRPIRGLFSIVGGIPTPTYYFSDTYIFYKYMVNIAQLVEHRSVVPSVVGSIPIIHTMVLYPSGLRERSAKASFVSSNLTETS